MLAFIHIQKTAGTTMKWILRNSFGIHHCDVEQVMPAKDPIPPLLPDDLRWICKIHPQLESIAGHSVTPYAGLEDIGQEIKYFSMLRSPTKQVASFFQFYCAYTGQQPKFEEWLAQEWTRNMQTTRLAGTGDAKAAREIILKKNIFIGLQEKFDESLLLLKTLVDQRLNIRYISQRIAPSQTVARELLNSGYYRKMIEDAVRADLELYEWVTQELYPSYQNRYCQLTGLAVSEFKRDNGRQGFSRNWMLNRMYRNGVYKPLLLFRRFSTQYHNRQ
jgi:hypothetical protein